MTLSWFLLPVITVLGSGMLAPQLLHILRSRCAAGVSLAGLCSTLLAYAAWMVHFLHVANPGALWALVLPASLQLATVLAAFAFGAERRGVLVPLSFAPALLAALLLGGWGAYSALLAASVLWAYLPAVHAAWTARDGGVSPLSWVLAALFGLCWVPVALESSDTALVANGLGNLVLASAVLLGLWVRSRRLQAVVLPTQRTPSDAPSRPVPGVRRPSASEDRRAGFTRR